MDSWSRPSKHAVTPPPLYLTHGDVVPYCHSCGRVIGERRKTNNVTEVKYCSARCRKNKPGQIDRKIEATFAKLLEGATAESLKSENGEDKEQADKEEKRAELTSPFGKEKAPKHKKKGSKTIKGDHRIIIECGLVEEIVFQRTKDPEKVYGRRKNRAPRFVVEKPEDWKSVDMVDKPDTPARPAVTNDLTSSEELSDSENDENEDNDDGGGIVLEANTPADGLPDEVEYGYGGGKIRPPQAQNDVNGSVGGEKGWAERLEETDEMKAKRREGQRRADEREMVRKAARRGCAFGFTVPGEEEKRKCEAVMKGVVVEPSFAKGEWGVRWRERV